MEGSLVGHVREIKFSGRLKQIIGTALVFQRSGD